MLKDPSIDLVELSLFKKPSLNQSKSISVIKLEEISVQRLQTVQSNEAREFSKNEEKFLKLDQIGEVFNLATESLQE
jgi:hypothetical protein